MLHYYMNKAIEQAKIALFEGEIPIGAVIVKDDMIISEAFNQKEMLQDPTAHAEMIAIRKAAESLGTWRLTTCTLYVTVEPCPMCMGAIIQSHIPKLVYGAVEKRFGGVESTVNMINHPMLPKNFEIYSGICEEECSELLKRFYRK